MNRDTLAGIARETVKICEGGGYDPPSGTRIDVAKDIENAVRGTAVYFAANLPPILPQQTPAETKIEVANETTFRGLVRMAARGGHIGCLNFASARNPGGGFLGGAQAQEEA